MAANLITNVQQVVQSAVTADLHCWLNSTVAFTGGPLVSSHTEQSRSAKNRAEHNIAKVENPADLPSRGMRAKAHTMHCFGFMDLTGPTIWTLFGIQKILQLGIPATTKSNQWHYSLSSKRSCFSVHDNLPYEVENREEIPSRIIR